MDSSRVTSSGHPGTGGDEAGHQRSVVVWDVPATVPCGKSFQARIGVKCLADCPPVAWTIEVHNHQGATMATVAPGADPWADTSGLYYAEVELKAPESPGLYGFKASAPTTPATSVDTEPHAAVEVGFNVRAVAAAECRLTVVAVDRESQMPVAGLRVVAHPYRTHTDDRGQAELQLPRGAYRVFVSGGGFLPFRVDSELTDDVTIRAELDQDRPPSDAELWS